MSDTTSTLDHLGASLRALLGGFIQGGAPPSGGASAGGAPSAGAAPSTPPPGSTLVGNLPIFVEDQDRALAFYRDKLGLTLLFDQTIGGIRWIAVAQYRGATEISLLHAENYRTRDVFPEFDSADQKWTAMTFLTDNIYATYRTWLERGVHFDFEPKIQAWGGILARFADSEGNHHHLVQPHDM